MPVILFIAALLGKVFGIIAVLVYIAIGLFVYPVFALGGGPKYIMNANFGYILAYIPAVFFASSILKIISVLKYPASFYCCGFGDSRYRCFYSMFIGVISQVPNSLLLGWIFAQSGTKILYDFMFSVLSIIVSGWVKKFLWITMC